MRWRTPLRVVVFLALAGLTRAAEIERVWLTHQTNDPSKLVVNWETAQPGDSVVEFGETPALAQSVKQAEAVTLHHVEIPLARRDVALHYRVRSGAQTSAVHALQGYPTKELRVAVFADTGYAKASWGEAVAKEKPHLLISAGDHIPSLHQGQPVAITDTAAFSKLVDRYPQLFASTPWLARSSAQLSAVWPPMVGSSASGRSFSMIFSTTCQVIGSM